MAWSVLHAFLLIITSVSMGIMGNPCGSADECDCWTYGHGFFANCSRRELNYIPSLPRNVTELDLSFNYLKLTNFCLSNHSYLRYLNMANNSLSHLPNLVFFGLKSLKLLDLSGNRLNLTADTYPREVFKPMVKLETLFLHGNIDANKESTYQFSYQDQALKYLSNLRKLTIDGLYKKSFGNGFQDLKIKELSMSGFDGSCNIGELDDATFTHLGNIETLNLSNCNIKRISKYAIQPLKNLVVLDLSFNIKLGFRPIRNVSYSLQFTRNVKVLNVSKVYSTFGLTTELTIRDIEYLKNSTMTEWNLNSNRMGLVQTNAALYFPPNLETLSVQDNAFTYGLHIFQFGCLKNLKIIKADFQGKTHALPVLHSLNLVGTTTHIDKLPNATCPWLNDSSILPLSHLFFPPKLREVHVSNSNIGMRILFIPFPQNNVDYLNASNNYFHTWQGPVLNLNALKFLDLSKNYCANISNYFFGTMTNVEVLIASKNYIGFPLQNDFDGKIFGHLKKLKHFDLSFNKIPENAFMDLSNILSLDLSYNSLSSLQITVSHMVNISTLDIQENNLRKLTKQITDHLGNVAAVRNISINMARNPIDCSCGNLEFLKWMNRHQRNMKHFEEYTCSDIDGSLVSMQHFNQHVMNLEKKCPSYAWVIILVTILITAFLSGVVGGLLYRHRWRLRHLFYMTKARYYGYRAIADAEVVENYKYDAFISYAAEDIKFIRDEIIEYLEKVKGLSLCIHQRDFLPGNAIADNIADAIQSSRKTVIILTRNYLKSKWCMFEFNMARMEGIYTRDGMSIMLMILKEDVPKRLLPLEMMNLAATDSYIEYPEDFLEREPFWNRVYQSIKQ